MAAEEKTESVPVSGGGSAGGSGNKLQMILTIVNVVATVAMGGILTVSFLREKHKTSVDDISSHEGEAGSHAEAAHGEGGEAKGHEGGEGGVKKSASEFGKMITLDQFTINLATVGSVSPKFVRVNISIEVNSDDTENELNQKMPQVKNTVIDLFNSKRPADLATPEGRDYLKDEIRKAMNDFLITGKVKGVFFTNFAVSG